MTRTYYSMTKTDDSATINIYGDITSWPWLEGDVSAVNLSKQLEQLTDVSEISVFINSYGGEVAEGLAIYNALKRHKAKIKTYCDGFACSIASVIFMAGDERIMNDSSLLMIHNAWTWAEGNANELRKQADDLDKITQASITAYKAHSNLTEKEIQKLLDNESWLLPEEALEYGFATAIEETASDMHFSQSAKKQLMSIVKKARAEADEDENEENPEDEETPEDETTDEEETVDEEETTDDESEDEPTEDEETDNEDSEDENTQEETAQKWSGFFNALTKF